MSHSLLWALLLASAGPLELQLISAAKAGDLGRVQALLAQGAKPHEENGDGETALCVAAGTGRAEVVRALAGRAWGFTNCKDGEVLTYAVRSGSPETVRFVAGAQQVALYPYRVHRAAALAARAGQPEVVRAVLLAGADLNVVDRELQATALEALAERGDLAGVEVLLSLGADPTLGVKRPPAEAATQSGHPEVAERLKKAAEAWAGARARLPAGAYLDEPRFSEIEALDGYALATLRNELFARHGYRFGGAQFSKAFERRPWYAPTRKTVPETDLGERERQVLARIKAREKALGGPLRFQ